jgi:hypothetical protein
MKFRIILVIWILVVEVIWLTWIYEGDALSHKVPFMKLRLLYWI